MPKSPTVTIVVPTVLRTRCGGASELSIAGANVREVLNEIERSQPELYKCVCDDSGKVRRHVNVFVNKDHMRDRKDVDTPLAAGDVITIMPAVSGG